MELRLCILAVFLLVSPAANAQTPLAAGTSPLLRAEAGYSYINVSVPGLYRIGLNGVDTSLTADVSRFLGIKADVGYARTPDVFGSGHHADLLSYLGGPVFYPVRTRRVDFSAQVLLGGARQAGVNTNGQGGTLTGYVSKFAWVAGGGAEIRLSRSTTLRLGADYLHTSFFAPTSSFKGQNNFRSTAGVVYNFGGRRR